MESSAVPKNSPFGGFTHEYVAIAQQLKDASDSMKPLRKRQSELKGLIIQWMVANNYQTVEILNGSQTLSITRRMKKHKPSKKDEVVQRIARAIGNDVGKATQLYTAVFEGGEEEEVTSLRRTDNKRKGTAAAPPKAKKRKICVLDNDDAGKPSGNLLEEAEAEQYDVDTSSDDDQ